MMTLPSLIVVADRGHLKAFKPSPQGGLQLLHATDFKEGTDKLSEQYTDSVGAFPNGSVAIDGTSTAERTKLRAMRNRRWLQLDIR